VTDHIILSASGMVTRVLGADSRSPLVVHKTQPSGFVSVAYRF
jgi:outer membrane protein